MVDGLDIKHSVMLIPLTMFFYLTAMLNPVILLKCKGPNCRVRMHSIFDDFNGTSDGFSNYSEWRNGRANLQSDGNVTLIKFNHGYVRCDSNCDDCEGRKDADKKCKDYDDTSYQLLVGTSKNLTHFFNDTNYSIPDFLIPECDCKDWCSGCDPDFVALPVDEDDGLHRHAFNYWNKLLKNCEEWELEYGIRSDGGEMCDLFNAFSLTMALTVIGFIWLGAVLTLMMFMEYTNFHIFYGGKCKFCFRTPLFKKILFTVLLTAPVSFMMWTMVQLRYGDTELYLDKYFDLIEAEFNYDWDTRGIKMFWVSIGLAILSIIVMMMSGTTQRHLRTVINYRRGVVYNGVDWKPHMS